MSDPQPPQPPNGGTLGYQYAKVYLDYTRQSNVAAERRLTKLLTIGLGGLASSGALLSHVAIQEFPFPGIGSIIIKLALAACTCIAAWQFIQSILRILNVEESMTMDDDSPFHPRVWRKPPNAIPHIDAHTNKDAVDSILKENHAMAKVVCERDDAYVAGKKTMIMAAGFLIMAFFGTTMIRGIAVTSAQYPASSQHDLRSNPATTVPKLGGNDGTAGDEAPAIQPAPNNDEPNGTQPTHAHDTTVLKPAVPPTVPNSQAHGRKP